MDLSIAHLLLLSPLPYRYHRRYRPVQRCHILFLDGEVDEAALYDPGLGIVVAAFATNEEEETAHPVGEEGDVDEEFKELEGSVDDVREQRLLELP